jgi:flagellar hook protein FlgE
MLDIMSQAAGAIEAYNSRLRAISSNITNIPVTGHKRTEVSFQEVFGKYINSGTRGSFADSTGGTNPIQYGGTVAIADTEIDFRQGDLTGGGNLDLAISGNGLFAISPDGGNTKLYTRNGEFIISGDKLLTKAGMQVYGFARSGGVSSTQLVPIDLTGISYDPTTITWDPNGVLRQSYDDSTGIYGAEIPFQIGLSSFSNPSALKYEDGTSFSETLASGSPSSPAVPGVGVISPRSKELSNVVYTSEIVDSMEIQRALSAGLTVVRLINDSITQFINKLG